MLYLRRFAIVVTDVVFRVTLTSHRYQECGCCVEVPSVLSVRASGAQVPTSIVLYRKSHAIELYLYEILSQVHVGASSRASRACRAAAEV